MLTGRAIFAAKTVPEIMAAVMMKEHDWHLLRANVPPSIRTLLRRCLVRETRNRLQSIGDARIVIEEYLSGSKEMSTVPTGTSRRRDQSGWIAAGISMIVTVALAIPAVDHYHETSLDTRTIRSTILPPPDTTLRSSLTAWAVPLLSPDGRRIVFGASTAERQDTAMDSHTGRTQCTTAGWY